MIKFIKSIWSVFLVVGALGFSIVGTINMMEPGTQIGWSSAAGGALAFAVMIIWIWSQDD